MCLPRRSSARPRGMTLVEMVVTSALLVIVVGILLGILIETRKSALQGQQRVALEEQARAVTNEIRSILEAAVPPDSLDLEGTSVTLRFGSDQCALISSKNSNGKDFYLTVIENAREKDLECVRLLTKVLDPARTLVPRESERILGTSWKEFSSTVRFEYATTIDEAMERKPFQKELNPGDYPRVIRIRVRVEPAKKEATSSSAGRIFELITAVRVL